MADPGEDGFGEWGRMDFRFVVRKAGYPLALRGAWLTVWCAVGLERRGGLIRWETVVGLVGKRLADTLVERGDLDREGDRDVRMHGWEVHQSPLERTRLQAAERQRRRREKLRQQGEDGEVLSRDATVTDRDERVTLSISLSSSSTGTGNGVVAESRDESPPAPAREGDDVWSVVLAVEEMTSVPGPTGTGPRSWRRSGGMSGTTERRGSWGPTGPSWGTGRSTRRNWCSGVTRPCSRSPRGRGQRRWSEPRRPRGHGSRGWRGPGTAPGR